MDSSPVCVNITRCTLTGIDEGLFSRTFSNEEAQRRSPGSDQSDADESEARARGAASREKRRPDSEGPLSRRGAFVLQARSPLRRGSNEDSAQADSKPWQLRPPLRRLRPRLLKPLPPNSTQITPFCCMNYAFFARNQRGLFCNEKSAKVCAVDAS